MMGAVLETMMEPPPPPPDNTTTVDTPSTPSPTKTTSQPQPPPPPTAPHHDNQRRWTGELPPSRYRPTSPFLLFHRTGFGRSGAMASGHHGWPWMRGFRYNDVLTCYRNCARNRNKTIPPLASSTSTAASTTNNPPSLSSAPTREQIYEALARFFRSHPHPTTTEVVSLATFWAMSVDDLNQYIYAWASDMFAAVDGEQHAQNKPPEKDENDAVD